MSRQKNPEGETSSTPTERTGIPDRAKEFISLKNPLQRGLNCNIVLVSPEDIPFIWETIEEQLRLMTPHSEGELEPEDFYESLMDENMQLWIASRDNEILASMITQVIFYPKKKVLRIISLAGGEMDKWIENIDMIEAWALSLGCTSLECWGRKGWLKILKDWRCSYHILTKDLTSRMH